MRTGFAEKMVTAISHKNTLMRGRLVERLQRLRNALWVYTQFYTPAKCISSSTLANSHGFFWSELK